MRIQCGFEHISDEDWSLNDFSGGCKMKAELPCQNTGSAKVENDKFKAYPNMNSPENSQSARFGSVAECESRCLSNCSCTAYAFNSSGCFIWESTFFNIQQLSEDDKIGGTIYVRLAASEFSSGENKSSSVIGIALGSVSVASFLLFAEALRVNTCSEGANKLLVYEYLENKSLDCHLFHEDESNILGWKTRYQIALGTARGLAYLHEGCREIIIHCDIKPENIRLDADFCPKVADFGLSKLMGRNFSSRVLTTMRGTRGYLAPEWISGVAITAKADVYSYGMMVFELISGKWNTEYSMEGVVRFFPSRAAEVMMNEDDVQLRF
ncbi:hypothetical protein OROHE_006059 [Orobanche hederae]